MGTERLDDIKRIFAINGSNIKGLTMDIFTGNRQVFKLAQSGAANIGQLINIIGADIKTAVCFSCGKVSKRTANTISLPAQPDAS